MKDKTYKTNVNAFFIISGTNFIIKNQKPSYNNLLTILTV